MPFNVSKPGVPTIAAGGAPSTKFAAVRLPTVTPASRIELPPPKSMTVSAPSCRDNADTCANSHMPATDVRSMMSFAAKSVIVS